jgi:hypothetical protein
MTLDQAKPGVRVKCSGFTCVQEGAIVTIERDAEGFPFFPCRRGGHWLNGCVGKDGELIGLEPVLMILALSEFFSAL